MEYLGLEKKEEGKFIHRYDLYYKTVDGQPKTYEIISRDKALKSFDQLHDKPADSVVLILTDPSGEKILINREYRMSVGEWVYNFPAGLIDPGETAEESARRELYEETGLSLVKITDRIGESYGAIGFSNEKSVCIVGIAEGSFKKSSSTLEEIEPGWYSRAQVRALLKEYRFAARTQAFCYFWSKE